MVNKIVDGIAKKLYELFGDTYTIYTEEVKQGLKKPCFFIFQLNSNHELVMGNRYFDRNFFVIQYFTNELNANRTMHEMADILKWEMEYITVDGNLTRGTGIRYEIVDGVLNLFVSYNCFMQKEKPELPKMEELQHDIDPKG